MMKAKKLGKFLVSILVIFSLLAGCSSGKTNTNEGKTENGTAEESGKPKFGGTLTVGMTADPDTLNPLVSNTTPGNWINSAIYPHLMTMNSNGEKVPYIADTFTTSEDGKTVTFKLKQGLKWQDGTPITSADVKFTGEYLAEHKLQWTAGIFESVESTETPDDLTVVYNLKQPYPGFAGTLGYWVRIVPKHIWEKVSDPKNFDNPEPIGAGPFKMVKWERGQYVEMEAVDEWFAAPEGKPYLDKVIFKIYPDINTMVLALQKGEVDVTAQDIPASAAKQLEANKAIKLEQTPSLGYAYYSFNLNPENPSPTQDAKFRVAMATATDKETIINVGLEGMGLNLETPVSPILKQWVDPSVKGPEYNVDKAKDLLSEAGYKDTDGDGIVNAPSEFGGENAELELMYDSANIYHQKTAKILEKNASDIGVKLVLKPVEYNTLSAKIFSEKDFEMHIGKWGALEESSDNMESLFHSKAQLNFMGLNNPELDKILTAAKYAPTEEEAIKNVFEFQKWYVDQFPVVPVYVQTFNLAYNEEKFGGFEMFPSDLQGLVDPNSLTKVYKK
jgi:peptide/nickel transport system substrate-binding protein